MRELVERLVPTTQDVQVAVIASLVMLVWIIVVVRVVGLRSFSKMSSFDFATTVAIGSSLATVSLTGQPLGLGLVAVVVLLGAQVVVARTRLALPFGLIENRPLLLMWEGEYVEEHLRRARVTTGDVQAKLRAANVGQLSKVRAVVLETTGDVSVLHGEQPLELALLDGVELPTSLRASLG